MSRGRYTRYGKMAMVMGTPKLILLFNCSTKEKKMKDAVIKKFVLELGGKEISLTPEQARKLYEGLSELFEKKVVVEERHHYHPPYWYWGTYTVPSTGITVSSGTIDPIRYT